MIKECWKGRDLSATEKILRAIIQSNEYVNSLVEILPSTNIIMTFPLFSLKQRLQPATDGHKLKKHSPVRLHRFLGKERLSCNAKYSKHNTTEKANIKTVLSI